LWETAAAEVINDLMIDQSELFIGDYFAGADCFNGSIDEVRITDGILTPTNFNVEPVGRTDLYPYPFYAKPTDNIRVSFRLNNPLGIVLNQSSNMTLYHNSSGTWTSIATSTPKVLTSLNFDINDSARASGYSDLYGRTYTPGAGMTFSSIHEGKFYESLNTTGLSNISISNDTAYSPYNKNITYSLWFKVAEDTKGVGSDGRQLILSKRGATGYEFELDRLNSTNSRALVLKTFSLDGVNGSYKSIGTYTVGQWHHMLLSFSGNSFTAYKDGVAYTGLTNLTGSGSAYLTLGGATDATGNTFFNGSIDEFYVWNKSMTAKEAADIYARTRRIKDNEWVYNLTDLGISSGQIKATVCPVRNNLVGECYDSQVVEVVNYAETTHPSLFGTQTDYDNILSKQNIADPYNVTNITISDLYSDCNNYYTSSLTQNSVLSYPDCSYRGLYINGNCAEPSYGAKLLASCYAINQSSIWLDGSKNWLDAYSRLRARDNYQRLQTAEQQANLATAYDLIYNALTSAEKTKYRDMMAIELVAVIDRDTGFEDINYQASPNNVSFSPGIMTNWEAIVWGGQIHQLYALRNELIPFTRWNSTSINHIRNFVDYMFGSDGSYAEPPHYFDYAMYTAVPTFVIMDRNNMDSLSGVDLNGLLDYNMWHTEPFPNPYATAVNARHSFMTFNDASKYGMHYASIFGYYADLLNSPVANWFYANQSFKKGGIIAGDQLFILRNYDPSIGFTAPSYGYKLKEFTPFKDFVIMRDGFGNVNNYQLGVYSGGYMYSHTHGGAGTFILNALGSRFIGDAGQGQNLSNGPYTGNDWEYSRLAESHNIVLADGKGSYTPCVDGACNIYNTTRDWQEYGMFLGPESIWGTFIKTYENTKYGLAKVNMTYAYNLKATRADNFSEAYRTYVTSFQGTPHLLTYDTYKVNSSTVHNWSYHLNTDKPYITMNRTVMNISWRDVLLRMSFDGLNIVNRAPETSSITNNSIVKAAGKFGMGYDFTNTSASRVRLDNFYNFTRESNNFTMCVWAKPNLFGTTEKRTFVTGTGVDASKLTCNGATNYFRFSLTNTSGSEFSTSTTNNIACTLNQWQLQCGVRAGNTAYAYINGTQTGTVDLTNAGPMRDTSRVTIGYSWSSPEWSFNGSLDEPMIWNRSLSATEIQKLWNETIQNSGYMMEQQTADLYVLPIEPVSPVVSIYNTSSTTYDSDVITFNRTSNNATFAVLMYPYNRSMDEPNITRIGNTSCSGMIINNEIIATRNGTGNMVCGGIVSDADVVMISDISSPTVSAREGGSFITYNGNYITNTNDLYDIPTNINNFNITFNNTYPGAIYCVDFTTEDAS
jgi:hypothetical protein